MKQETCKAHGLQKRGIVTMQKRTWKSTHQLPSALSENKNEPVGVKRRMEAIGTHGSSYAYTKLYSVFLFCSEIHASSTVYTP
jgi:hypothetical protein